MKSLSEGSIASSQLLVNEFHTAGFHSKGSHLEYKVKAMVFVSKGH